MKAREHNWEEDLRQQVEQHEFDFDPQAWEEMEALLDQGTAPGGGPTPSSEKGSFWSLGKLWWLGAVLIVGIAVWWGTQSTSSKAVEIGGFTMVVNSGVKDTVAASTAVPETVITKEDSPEKQNIGPKKKSIEQQIIDVPLSDGFPQAEEEEDSFQLEVMPLLAPLPAWRKPEMIEMLYPEGFELAPPTLPRRKRNRRKLFPDVINKF